MIYLLSKGGNRNIALRYSEFEGMDTIRNMQGLVDWVWVDCFTRLPIGKAEMAELKQMGYKTCLVSPELQGRPEDIRKYKAYLEEQGVLVDAVCSKCYNAKIWVE
jgi:hypothetical protein